MHPARLEPSRGPLAHPSTVTPELAARAWRRVRVVPASHAAELARRLAIDGLRRLDRVSHVSAGHAARECWHSLRGRGQARHVLRTSSQRPRSGGRRRLGCSHDSSIVYGHLGTRPGGLSRFRARRSPRLGMSSRRPLRLSLGLGAHAVSLSPRPTPAPRSSLPHRTPSRHALARADGVLHSNAYLPRFKRAL